MTYEIIVGESAYRLELSRAAGVWECRLNGREVAVDVRQVRPDVLSLLIEGRQYEIRRERSLGKVQLWIGGVCYPVEVRDPRSLRGRGAAARDAQGPVRLIASMPGKVVRLLAAENSAVEAGQGIMVVEAMKMQNEIKSPKPGILSKIVAGEGSTVNAGDVLAIVE